MVFLVGLTGGIAAGKSTVASLWASLGATVIDADVLAREVVEPNSVGFAEVAREFPKAITNCELDRKALASIVFADAVEREKLERILHPLIQAKSMRLI